MDIKADGIFRDMIMCVEHICNNGLIKFHEHKFFFGINVSRRRSKELIGVLQMWNPVWWQSLSDSFSKESTDHE